MKTLHVEPIYDKTVRGKVNIACCGYLTDSFNEEKHLLPLQRFLEAKRKGDYSNFNLTIVVCDGFPVDSTPTQDVALLRVTHPLRGWYKHLHRYLLPYFFPDEWYIFRGTDNLNWRLQHFLNLIQICNIAGLKLITTPSWSGGSHHAKIITGSFACKSDVAVHLKTFLHTLSQQPGLDTNFNVDEIILDAWFRTQYFPNLLDIIGPIIHFAGWTDLQKHLYLGPRTVLFKEHCGFKDQQSLPTLETK